MELLSGSLSRNEERKKREKGRRGKKEEKEIDKCVVPTTIFYSGFAYHSHS